jgi:tRNA dimethylallyltransferase
LDIGSNKVTEEDRRRVRHHMLDEVEFWQEFNIATFYNACCSNIEAILERQHVPILVGGAGYYLRSLMRGLPTTPMVDESIEQQIQQELNADPDWETSLKRLKKIDPTYAATLQENDYYRLRRALGVFEVSGKPVSSFTDQKETRWKYDWRCIFLSTDRIMLNRTVDRRVESMIEHGLISEVAKLMYEKGFSEQYMAGKAIGYRETIQFLRTMMNLKQQTNDHPWNQTDSLFLSYLNELMRHSRQYAKRQWTWFRNEPDYVWIDSSQDSSFLEARLLDLYTMSRENYDIQIKEMRNMNIVGHDQRTQRKIMKDYKSQLSIYHNANKRRKLLDMIWENDLKTETMRDYDIHEK